MIRTSLSAVLSALALAVAVGVASAQSSPRPPANIILITTDDQGYHDLTIQGSRDIPTPHLDSIGLNGVRFTDGYVTAPLCGPSRAAFITGQYQQRVGIEGNPGGRGPNLEAPRLSQLLQEAGYTTGIIGKWHLGTDHDYLPNQTGFDYFWGTPTWGHYFLPPSVEELEAGGDSWMRSFHDGRDSVPRGFLAGSYNNLYRNGQRVVSLEYMTTTISDEAVNFIDRSNGQPFFLHVSYNAPHTPLQAPQRYLDRFLHIPDEGRRTYAAMVSAVDDGVGRIFRKLKEEEIYDNTLVFFFADNGGANYSHEPENLAALTIVGSNNEQSFVERFGESLLRWGRHSEQRIGANHSDNGPLRFGKGNLFEGGIRVPFLVKWPAVIPPGQVIDHPVISLDLFPTALAAAGIEKPNDLNLDGVNLVPYLTGERDGRPHQTLYWRFRNSHAVRDGDWKLLVTPSNLQLLFNLADDIGEVNDLSNSHPDIVAELSAKFEAWNDTLPRRGERLGALTTDRELGPNDVQPGLPLPGANESAGRVP